MKKYFSNIFLSLFISLLVLSIGNIAFANNYGTHTVKSGDTLWKIAVQYEVGVSELINSNTQLANPDLIYPGQAINIPNISDVKSIENEVINLVNRERQSRGLSPLSYNWELSRVARYKSQDMIDKNYFSHTSPTYGSPFKMMTDFGINYSYAGENIAMGQRSATEVMDGWMNSPGHRKNILSPNYTQIGVGYAVDKNGTPYWTQMFIK